MSYLKPNLFTSYHLTEEERIEGSKLTQLQAHVIHTQRSEIAEQKSLLKLDPSNIQQYLQEEAYLRGQIDILTYLLDTSNSLTELEINSDEE